jgi:hypothetical protein
MRSLRATAHLKLRLKDYTRSLSKALVALRALAYIKSFSSKILYNLISYGLPQELQLKDCTRSFSKALIALRALAYIKSYSLPKRMAAA